MDPNAVHPTAWPLWSEGWCSSTYRCWNQGNVQTPATPPQAGQRPRTWAIPGSIFSKSAALRLSFLSVKWGWQWFLPHTVVKHSQGLTPLPGMVQTLSSSHKDCFLYKTRSLISREVRKALQRLCFLPCALYSWLGRVSGGNRTARPQAGLPASFLQGQVEGKLVSHLTPVTTTHCTYYFSFGWLVGQDYTEKENCAASSSFLLSERCFQMELKWGASGELGEGGRQD